MSETTPALQVRDLVKTFRVHFFQRRVKAVRGVSFDVRPGEIFGLLGPNGAGKTTLIKTAMGLIFPTGGEVTIFGSDVRRTASRADVGYCPENPYFHEYLTPLELLDFYGRLCGLDRAAIEARSGELISQVGLGDAARRPLRKFSKGMLQRIGLAQALIGQPRLLLLDEPMSGLDPIGRREVADLIRAKNNEGTTIVFSSHILSDVERLCDRVVILNRGEVAAAGTIDELVGPETGTATLEELFLEKAIAAGD